MKNKKKKKSIKKKGPNPNKITKKQSSTIDFFFQELRNNRATDKTEEQCWFEAYRKAGYKSNTRQAIKIFNETKIKNEIKRLRVTKTRGAPLTLFNDEIKNQLYEKMEKGISNTAACKIIGLNWATFSKWLKRGRKERKEGKTSIDSDYVNFVNLLETAKERGKEELLDIVIKDARGGNKVREEKKIIVDGRVLQRDIKKKETLPNAQSAKYLLAVSDRDKYAIGAASGNTATKNKDVNDSYKVSTMLMTLFSEICMSSGIDIENE